LDDDTQKPVVVNYLCTGAFENIAHIRDAAFPPSDMLSMRQPRLSRFGTRRRGSRCHADSFDRTANGGGRLMVRIVESGQVVKYPAAHYRARHWQQHFKV